MFRSSKLFNLSRNFKFQNKTNVHHKLCLTLDHKLIANQYLNRHLQTLSVRHYSSMFSHGNTDKTDENTCLDPILFEKVSGETLEELADTFDALLEETYLFEFDTTLSNGVLTVQLSQNGTYVINKQTPNRQLWLSSPTSGPKRYDYIEGKWIYHRDGHCLQDLLSKEFSQILGKPVTI